MGNKRLIQWSISFKNPHLKQNNGSNSINPIQARGLSGTPQRLLSATFGAFELIFLNYATFPKVFKIGNHYHVI